MAIIALVLLYRLHEFDQQVCWVREGMARVIPVPLLSLFTGFELETMVSNVHLELIIFGDICKLDVFKIT